MKDWKRIGEKILFLPLGLVLLFVAAAAAMLILLFGNGLEECWYAYAVYVFAFYTLMVITAACVRTVPKSYRSIKEKLYQNAYTKRYLTEIPYKTKVNLHASLCGNLFYVAYNAAAAVRYQTHWFAIFAIYYGIMAIMRFLLVRYLGKNQVGDSRLGELKRSRVCACLLLTVNLTLSGVVLMMIYYGRGFHYRGYLIYIMAAYTFYITGTAIRDLIKYRKYKSPVMSVSKIVKLASSLFSMLFLETAMFAQFGGETSEETEKIMIMMTGAGICAIVVAMSIYMITRSTKEIRVYGNREKE